MRFQEDTERIGPATPLAVGVGGVSKDQKCAAFHRHFLVCPWDRWNCEKDSGATRSLNGIPTPRRRLQGASHPVFQFHAEPVCNAVDEIEVGDHQGSIEDGSVAPTGLAKKVYVAFPARRRLACELLGEFQQGELRSGDRRIPIVEDDGLDQQRIPGFFAEALRMVADSIVTRVRFRDYDRDHLSLRPAEFRSTEHECPVEVEMGAQRSGIETVNLQNVGDVAGRVVHPIVLFQKFALTFLGRNYLNPGHTFPPSCGPLA